jgi:hypothetical protein
MVPSTLNWLGLMVANDMHIDSLRMDPSGENKKLAAMLQEASQPRPPRRNFGSCSVPTRF